MSTGPTRENLAKARHTTLTGTSRSRGGRNEWEYDAEADVLCDQCTQGGRADSAGVMVFDAAGRLLGEVAFPVRFEPRAITDERVYGVWTDELDIEQVRVYALRRGPASADVP